MAGGERIRSDGFFDRFGRKSEDKLHRASNADVLRKLLFETEDHNALDSNGDAPLHSYVKRRDKERFDCLVTFLTYSKCDINYQNIDGQTALHLACEISDMQVAKALIAFDATINIVNIDDHTPLDLVEKDSALEEFLVLLGALRYHEIRRSRVQGDGVGISFLDDAEEEDAVTSAYLDQQGGASPERINVEQSSCHSGADLCTGAYNTSLSDSTPSGLSSLPEEQEDLEQVYKDRAARDMDPDRERERTQGSLDEISLGMAGTVIEGTDTSESETQKPLMGCGGGLSESYSLDHHPETLSAAYQGRQERRTRREISMRRKNMFRRQNSETAKRTCDPDVEVVDSVIGQSVVRADLGLSQKQQDQRVLCLDGGGIKGLIQIEMLKTIEQMTGKSISELFDWVVGTSTGGILTLAMIYGGQSLENLRRMYFGMKDTAFKQHFKYLCDTNALEDLIKGVVGTEKRMGDIKKPKVLISAVNKSTDALPLVFFNNCFADEDFNNELVWKVARYTSAAPGFFAECDNYIDGGVKANNPTAFGITEIQDYLSKQGSSAAKLSCVVSLGCGIYPPEPLGNTDISNALTLSKFGKLPRCLWQLFSLMKSTIGSSDEISRHCETICKQQCIDYFRFSPKIGEEVGMTEKDNRKLCEIIIKAKQLFRENPEQVEKMIEQLGCKVKEDYLCYI